MEALEHLSKAREEPHSAYFLSKEFFFVSYPILVMATTHPGLGEQLYRLHRVAQAAELSEAHAVDGQAVPRRKGLAAEFSGVGKGLQYANFCSAAPYGGFAVPD